jgi:glyoxylase-like metal-dependent hydrolase (beta-lactamase superfamily II)
MAAQVYVSLGEGAGYFPSGSNVGVWEGPEGAVLIDSGNDADAGRRLLRALEASGRKLAAVVLTHSNADHMGGSAFLASRTGVPVYASRIEAALCADPILEPNFIWGGNPPRELRGKFFVAPSCAVLPLPGEISALPALGGLESIPLPGHFFAQWGWVAGGVLFAGDAVFGERSVAKHPIFFVHDVAAFLSSLETIATLPARLVLPSHGEPVEDASALAAANRAAVERVAAAVVEACAGGASFEDVLAFVCGRFGVDLDWAQYALVGSTVRSYLVYLRERGALSADFAGNRLIWRRT